MLLPSPGSTLAARFTGPYVIQSKRSDTDYEILTPERRRKMRLCHVNMLKSYLCHTGKTGKENFTESELQVPEEKQVSILSRTLVIEEGDDGLNMSTDLLNGGCLKNSEVLNLLPFQLSHLSSDQRQNVIELVESFPELFNDVPSGTSVIKHDIEAGNALPIKQHPYRCPVGKREIMKQEVKYLVQNGFAKKSNSPWSSPCVLAPKVDGSFRFCTDFRKVNSVTVPDAFPLAHM